MSSSSENSSKKRSLGTESDSQAQADMIHEDVQWQPAFYGTAPIGKAEFVEYLIAWQDAMAVSYTHLTLPTKRIV